VLASTTCPLTTVGPDSFCPQPASIAHTSANKQAEV
jgi:hypothetical protein